MWLCTRCGYEQEERFDRCPVCKSDNATVPRSIKKKIIVSDEGEGEDSIP